MRSLQALLALTALMILEVLPSTGSLLAKAGASFVAGWLVHFFFLSILVDVLTGTFPIAAAAIPILVYSGYYFAYWDQKRHVSYVSDRLRKSNPARVLNFDSLTYSLVMNDADVFVASHEIPVVYTRGASYKPEEYLSYRLVLASRLDSILQDSAIRLQVLSVYWNDAVQREVRELAIPERPALKILAATVFDSAGEGWKDWNIGFETTSIVLEGKTIGVFKSGYFHRLPIFPFLAIGCEFSPDMRRTCGAEFVTERTPIESTPDAVDRSLYDDPVSVMLGIRKLSKKDFSEFHGFGADPAAGAAGPTRAAPGEDAAFDALRGLVYGQSPALSWTMSYLIANNPRRLAPFATGMAKRFVELDRADSAEAPGRREQAALLAAGLAALAPADLAGVQEQLANFVRKAGAADEHPLLYLRLADVGPSLFSVYRDRLLDPNATRMEILLSALAICRIGQADSELISAIKAHWSEYQSGTAKDESYKAALFVTLLKLGQENSLRNTDRSDSTMLQAWYDAVLAGRGKTDLGPNNCMPMEWPGKEYVPAILAPSLRWSQQRWSAQ